MERLTRAGIGTEERRWALKVLGGAAGAILAGCAGELAEGSASTTSSKVRGRGSRTRERMQSYVARGEIPGIVTAVRRGGATQVEPVGTLSVGGPPMPRDAIFRVASMTKPVTAVATMILVEEQKLQLDEPVDRLLPELAHRRVLKRVDGPLDDTVPAARPITVRDLLTFTMGLGIVMAPASAAPIRKAMDNLALGQGMPRPAPVPPPDEWMRRLGTLPLMAQPGERWMYNTGSDVLGVLVARAARRPFERFLRERIFEPLGMKDTAFFVPEAKRDRFVTSYVGSPKTGFLEVYDAPDGQWSEPPAFPSGAAGLVSTADDFLAFGRMMLDGGRSEGGRIVSEASVAQMTTDQLTASQKIASPFTSLSPDFFDDQTWGFGMCVATRPNASAGSAGAFGWDGGLGTSWRTDPAAGLVGVLLTQRAWTSPLPPPVCRDFWSSLYS